MNEETEDKTILRSMTKNYYEKSNIIGMLPDAT